jgi:hypothetical protein
MILNQLPGAGLILSGLEDLHNGKCDRSDALNRIRLGFSQGSFNPRARVDLFPSKKIAELILGC